MQTVLIEGDITQEQARQIVEEANRDLTEKGKVYRAEVGPHTAGAGGEGLATIAGITALVVQTVEFLLAAWNRWGKSTGDSSEPGSAEVQALFRSHGDSDLVRTENLRSLLSDGRDDCRLIVDQTEEQTRVVLSLRGTIDRIAIYIEQ